MIRPYWKRGTILGFIPRQGRGLFVSNEAPTINILRYWKEPGDRLLCAPCAWREVSLYNGYFVGYEPAKEY